MKKKTESISKYVEVIFYVNSFLSKKTGFSASIEIFLKNRRLNCSINLNLNIQTEQTYLIYKFEFALQSMKRIIQSNFKLAPGDLSQNPG